MLVQTVGLTGQKYLGEAPDPLSAYQITDAEVEINFTADLAALPVEYALSNFVFDYDKVTYVDSMPILAWSNAIFAIGEFKAKTNGIVSIDLGTRNQTQAKIYTDDSVYVNEFITLTDFTFTETIGDFGAWSMKNYKINVEAGKTYYVTARNDLGRVRMRTPGIVLFVQNGWDDFQNGGYPLKYFYVPIGTKKIAYKDPQLQPTNERGYLIAPGGTGLVRTATTAAGIYTVDVPEGQDGKVWTANFGHGSWSFVNIPNISTLQYFNYTEAN